MEFTLSVQHHRAVSFLGDGWVERDIRSLDLARDTISFMFKTTKADSMLLLAVGKYVSSHGMVLALG
jgi:hypothetical protein